MNAWLYFQEKTTDPPSRTLNGFFCNSADQSNSMTLHFSKIKNLFVNRYLREEAKSFLVFNLIYAQCALLSSMSEYGFYSRTF